MNNDFLRQNDDGIGIDPTTLEVIESLDDPATPDNTSFDSKNKGKKVNLSKIAKSVKTKEPKEPKQKKVNPDAKPGDGQKKLILIILVIALIGGVGYGIYWYLNLGTKNNEKNNKKYLLNEVYATVDDTLSDSILDYGSFPGVDLKECSLDTSSVNINEVGDYPYYITCSGTKYNSIVHVIPLPEFHISYNLAVTNVDGELPLESLYIPTTEEVYTPSIIDEDELNNKLSTSGFKKIDFYLSNDLGQRGTATGTVYVLDRESDNTLTCRSDELTANNRKYTITETAYFDASGVKIAILKNYIFNLSADDLDQVVNDIKEDGTVTYNSITGYAFIDSSNYTLTLIKESDESTTNNKGKDELASYYKNSKSYTCE